MYEPAFYTFDRLYFSGLPCDPKPQTQQVAKPAPTPEMEKQMSDYNIIANERRALENSLYAFKRDHEKEINELCHIGAIEPKTMKEAIDWIKADKFKVLVDGEDNSEAMDDEDVLEWSRWYHHISFNTEKPEVIKAKKLKAKMEEDYDAVKLRIQIYEPEKALKEVEEFKKRTYH